MPVTRSRISEAAPAGDFAVSYCDYMHALALELLLRITRIAGYSMKRCVVDSSKSTGRLTDTRINNLGSALTGLWEYHG